MSHIAHIVSLAGLFSPYTKHLDAKNDRCEAPRKAACLATLLWTCVARDAFDSQREVGQVVNYLCCGITNASNLG